MQHVFQPYHSQLKHMSSSSAAEECSYGFKWFAHKPSLLVPFHMIFPSCGLHYGAKIVHAKLAALDEGCAWSALEFLLLFLDRHLTLDTFIGS